MAGSNPLVATCHGIAVTSPKGFLIDGLYETFLSSPAGGVSIDPSQSEWLSLICLFLLKVAEFCLNFSGLAIPCFLQRFLLAELTPADGLSTDYGLGIIR